MEDTSPVGKFEAPAKSDFERPAGDALNKPTKCGNCEGRGWFYRRRNGNLERLICEACEGIGWHGINPKAACPARPGSPLKIGFLAARYRVGVLLWNRHDRTK